MPLRAPPRLPVAITTELPADVVNYLRGLDAWANDLHRSLSAILPALEKDKQGRSLPVELPVLPYADIAGTKYRAGGPPAIVAIPDGPGGMTIAIRDGTAWRLLERA